MQILHDTSRSSPNVPFFKRHGVKAALDAAQKTLADSQPALNAAQVLQDQVASLKTQLATQQTAHEQALVARDQQIASLTTSTQNLQNQFKTVDELRSQIQQISLRLPNR